ncbi:MAG: hypothetical protein V1859_11245 [archaeon]
MTYAQPVCFTVNKYGCIEYTHNHIQIGVGAVAYLKRTSDGKFASVLKTDPNTFQGSRVFPGGMARANGYAASGLNTWDDVYKTAQLSLLERLAMEVGVCRDSVTSIDRLPNLYDAFTQYATRDGVTRVTRVFVYEAYTSASELCVHPSDQTVREPKWFGFSDLEYDLNWVPPNLHLLKLLMAKEHLENDLPPPVLAAIDSAQTHFIAQLHARISPYSLVAPENGAK